MGSSDDHGRDPGAGALGRRGFLQIAGAAAALGSLGACFTAPHDRVYPYTQRPPDVTPGRSEAYATAWELHGYGVGLVVESREGRPIKVDGNPEHPASLGATGPLEQALLMQLYDPARPRWVTRRGAPSDLRALQRFALDRARRHRADRGAGLRFLVPPTASPYLGSLRDRVEARYPRARVVAWDALSRDAILEGTRRAFGAPLEPLVRYDELRVLVTLDADVLGFGPTRLADARRVADARAPRADMLRLYAVEPTMTLTGMFADHRLRVAPSGVERFGRALLRALHARGVPGLDAARALPGADDPPEVKRFADAVAADLARTGDRGLVVAGAGQPPEVHLLAWAIDEALGARAARVRLVPPPVRERVTGERALAPLLDELRAGEVETLVVTAFDPAYTAAGLGFAEAARGARELVYLAPAADATAALATWVAPHPTVLERWGDTRAVDGTAAIAQPLLAPLFDGTTEAHLLAPFAGEPDLDPHRGLQAFWRGRLGVARFDDAWREALRRGAIPETEAAEVRPRLDRAAVVRAASRPLPPPAPLELQLRPGYALHDGEFAWNPWLLELPDPVTRQAWGNAALLSPGTARALGVTTGAPVRVAAGAAAIALPAYVLPGQADGAVTVALGHGRGEDRGASAYPLRRRGAFWSAPGATVTRAPDAPPLVRVQLQDTEAGRPIAIAATLDDLAREGPAFLHDHKGPVEKLYDPYVAQAESPYRWAMAIDLQRCIGCAACVVACQAENNVPTVGPDEVARGREMHWLRIDRYFQGPEEDPRAVTQPLACVHCEAAPCEYVCPVNATVHTDEGLNEMVYNRCIGTRFCSNNCPYKVRRFNFLGYHEGESPLVALGRNPEVSVRNQGVMEKCTYCVQRIERARIGARIRGEEIDTVSLRSACAQACPTRAIVFGSLHVEDAPVSRLHADRRRYDLLHDLGTRPRTAYLARIRDPNPELE